MKTVCYSTIGMALGWWPFIMNAFSRGKGVCHDIAGPAVVGGGGEQLRQP